VGSTSSAHCLVMWPHLIARDAGKCSLGAQEREKMSLGKGALPEAYLICSDPRWRAHRFSAVQA